MKKIDRGICVRLCPLSDEEIAAGLTPERRLSIALARARAYARVGDPYADLIAETYAMLAVRLATEVAVGKRSKPPDCGSGNRGFKSRRPPPAERSAR